MVHPEREDPAAGAPADPESPASSEQWAGGAGEPGEGDAILGATLDALKRAAQGVEIERQVAETLQRSLLPRLPVVPGLRLAARYRPGSAESRIGGDWYDLNEEQTALVGRNTGRTLRLADRVEVVVRSVEPARGRVDLEPAAELAAAAT